MIQSESITGTILGVTDCCSLVIVYLGTNEGRVLPIMFARRPFSWLLDGENCSAEQLVGRTASYDAKSLFFD